MKQKAPPHPSEKEGSEPAPSEGADAASSQGETNAIRVLKFGGSSLQTAERVGNVADLVIRARSEAVPVVVVSAVGGTTDLLVDIADLSGRGDEGYEELIQTVRSRHVELLHEVAPTDEVEALEGRVEEIVTDLKKLARGAHLLGECSIRTRDRILATGELLSAMLLSAGLRARGLASRDVDARELIRTDERFGSARVDHAWSETRIREVLPGDREVAVVTGFVGSTPSGETTTLGRGASDYTATLVGAALRAEGVEIWTDVDGVLTADPRCVPDAAPVREIGYEELLELAHFGAEVMCPPAVDPARKAGIPLRIRSTLDPSLPGTLVVGRPPPDPYQPVRGISAIGDAALVRLEGVEHIGVTEATERLFRAIRTADVDSLLFTQDSSAHSVSIAVGRDDLQRSIGAIKAEFRRERESGDLSEPVIEEDRSVLAIVGEGMRDTPGIAGRLFSTLGASKVNVHAVAQGSSERNISWVVASEDEGVALRAVHRAFFTPPGQPHPVRVVVLGVGSVGGTFLDQLRDHGEEALAPHGMRPVLVGIGQSRKAVADLEGLDPARWRELLDEGDVDPDEVVDAVVTGDPLVVVDCTASPGVAERYPEYLKAGAGIVTANKIAFSEGGDAYRTLLRAAEGNGGVHYETTVGAGLPMVGTVAELHRSGDRIEEMEGVLSGTLTYLFDEVNQGRPISEAVKAAREQGISEPDPREDLGLTDVVRKLIILGRTAGFDLEPGDVRIEPILPPHLLEAESVEAFMEGLPELDEEIAERSQAARQKGCRLATVARIDGSGAKVGMEVVPEDRPAARIRGTENVLVVRTLRYSEYPVLVQGPGAGPKVTAAGLMTDLVKAAERVTHALRKPINGS